MRFQITTALAAILAAPGMALAQTEIETGAETVEANEIITLNTWAYEDLYASGWSAEEFIDEMEVYGALDEDIGDVEDLVVNPEGRLIAVIAEVGGIWDIGDTHVSVPWDEVEILDARDGISVPLTEENVEEYEAFEFPVLEDVGEQVAMGVDDAELGPRAFRLSELIGDYARLRGDGEVAVDDPAAARIGPMVDYGYVNDVIVSDGQIAAVVVDPATAFGRGYYAYPYYGYADGYWEPGYGYYDLPYTEEEVAELDEFDYGELELSVEAEELEELD